MSVARIARLRHFANKLVGLDRPGAHGLCGDVASDDFIVTTWHRDEPLSDVFDFASRLAEHPTLNLEDLLVLHLAHRPEPKCAFRGC